MGDGVGAGMGVGAGDGGWEPKKENCSEFLPPSYEEKPLSQKCNAPVGRQPPAESNSGGN